MARPKKEIDEKMLEKLAYLHLSDRAISHILGVSVQTLNRRYGQLIDKAKSESILKIAAVLFDEALTNREPWAIKLLAAKHLGYAEKSPIEVMDNSENIHSRIVNVINQIEGGSDGKNKEDSEEED